MGGYCYCLYFTVGQTEAQRDKDPACSHSLKVRKLGYSEALPGFCRWPGSQDAEDLYDSDQLLERKT